MEEKKHKKTAEHKIRNEQMQKKEVEGKNE